ncbi:MAG: hypothetical protein HYX38_28470 [Rhodospirillales bacterium]|nr:hypothetical protein [Rhodospirillales bacterium]
MARAQGSAKAGESVAADSPWTFTFAPYGWLTFMSGTQTVAGQTLQTNTNAFEMYAESQSLISIMAYAEARYEDRLGLFVDLVYANLTAGKSATRGLFLPGVSGNAVASASVNYETLTLQFGAAYEVVKVGPDRSAEGQGVAGVGQTAFDVTVGGRWWYQRVDMTLNFYGAVTVNTPNLQVSANRSQVFANSGSIGWVDPFIGFRVRHHLALGQRLALEADLGGFGIGSRISAEAQLAYSMEFGNAIGVNWAGVIGYRALYVDYTQGSGSSFFEMNMLQHGPLLGVRGRF